MLVTDIPRATSGRTALETAIAVARQAGTLLREGFHQQKQVTLKGQGSVVTQWDLASERLIVEALSKEFPRCAIVAEESGEKKGDTGLVWYVDPLDGSRNYSLGVPFYSVTIALARGDDVLVGVTYDPSRDEMFAAQKAQGTTLNGQRVHASQHAALQDAIVALDVGHKDPKVKLTMEMLAALWPGMQSIRIMGSSALGLAYVAAGRIDLYFNPELQPWDMAAGVLLIQEAGAVITDKTGRPMTLHGKHLIAASPAVHTDFLRRTKGMPWRTA